MFNDLVNNRKEAIQARQYKIRSLTKSGQPSKGTVDPRNCVGSLEEAQQRVSEMEKMNPGRKYVITE